MSWRMASKTILNRASYLFSSASSFPASSAWEVRIWRTHEGAHDLDIDLIQEGHFYFCGTWRRRHIGLTTPPAAAVGRYNQRP